jgi:hypothetical protein
LDTIDTTCKKVLGQPSDQCLDAYASTLAATSIICKVWLGDTIECPELFEHPLDVASFVEVPGTDARAATAPDGSSSSASGVKSPPEKPPLQVVDGKTDATDGKELE